MANTWANTTYDNIANRGFTAFLAKLAPLGAFTTDYSSEVAEQGDAVKTRIVPAAAAAGDLQSTHSGVRSASAGDKTLTGVSVTLNQQPISGFHITDEEAKKIGSGIWNDTFTRLVNTSAYSVANAVLNYVFNLVTAASYSNLAFTGAASTFDLADVMDINAVLAAAGWPVDLDGEIAMVLSPTYRAALKKDGAVQDVSKSGIAGVIARGALDQVDIFRLYQAPTLPPAGGTPAAENLTGFVATQEALAVAMRPVDSQVPSDLVDQRLMVDPDTGATMVFRSFYDPDKGKLYNTFETLFGAGVGKATALQRIRSAAP